MNYYFQIVRITRYFFENYFFTGDKKRDKNGDLILFIQFKNKKKIKYSSNHTKKNPQHAIRKSNTNG